MTAELLVDTNVLSYLFNRSQYGIEYEALIACRRMGIVVLSLEELHYGVAHKGWSAEKIVRLDVFLREFFLLPARPVVAEICGNLRAARACVGRPIALPDAWIAATALWYDLPVVTHDRDLEGIPGLRVLTLHDEWCVRDNIVPAVYGSHRTTVKLGIEANATDRAVRGESYPRWPDGIHRAARRGVSQNFAAMQFVNALCKFPGTGSPRATAPSNTYRPPTL